MSPYWAAAAVVLVPLGGAFKYLVWDFFNKVQSLDTQYCADIAGAHAAIHDRKFLPIIVEIHDLIETRKAILPGGPALTAEILTELPIDANARRLIDVIAERIALDRSYRLACGLSKWVWFTWLIFIALAAILFFSHYNDAVGLKSLYVPKLLIPITIILGAGCIVLTAYRWALNKFIRTLRANPL